MTIRTSEKILKRNKLTFIKQSYSKCKFPLARLIVHSLYEHHVVLSCAAKPVQHGGAVSRHSREGEET